MNGSRNHVQFISFQSSLPPGEEARKVQNGILHNAHTDVLTRIKHVRIFYFKALCCTTALKRSYHSAQLYLEFSV